MHSIGGVESLAGILVRASDGGSLQYIERKNPGSIDILLKILAEHRSVLLSALESVAIAVHDEDIDEEEWD